MLQRFRENLKGTVATFLVTLMIIPFALFGVDSLFLQDGSPNEAASVNGEVITEQELRQGIFLQKQQMLSRFGENIPADFLTDERLREPVLNGLIQRRLITQEAEDGGMAISDRTLDQLILSAEQFQQDGVFNRGLYMQLLRSMGYTAVGYKRLLERDMLLSQYAAGFSGSSFITPTELQQNAALSQQARSFYYLTIPLAGRLEQQSVSDDEVDTYYQANQAAFIAPEQIAVEYIDVTPSGLVSDLEFSEEQLREQYQQDIAAFAPNVERRAAHILIERKDDGSDKTIAETVKQRLADGEDFAVLVTDFSDDLSSKEQGGDVGFTAGDIFPDAFEEALAALKVGETSDAVETDSGLHFIKLLEEQGAEPPSFEEQRMKIVQALMDAEAEALFVDLLERLGDLSYNAENLEEVGEELGLSVGKTGLFGRSGGQGLVSDPKVLSVAFSDEVLVEGNTSEVIELDDSRVAVIRVVEHKPSHTKALELVKEEIINTLKRDKAKQELLATATALETQIRGGGDVEALAKSNDLEWQVSLLAKRTDPQIDREILKHVFALPKPDQKPEVSGLHLTSGDYVVVSLTKVEEGRAQDLPKDQQDSMAISMVRSAGMNDYAAFEAFLKEQAEIKIR